MTKEQKMWVLLATIFMVSGTYHLFQLSSSIPKFEYTPNKGEHFDFANSAADEARVNILTFTNHWNEYVTTQNTASSITNFISAATYFLSAFSAFRSVGLSKPK